MDGEVSKKTKTTRILYILPQPFLIPRGSSFRALATVKAITELGIHVDFLSYPVGKEVTVEGLNVIRWRSIPCFKAIKIGPSFKKFLMDIPLFLKSLHLILTNKYDLIHGPEEAGIMAAIYGRIFGIPYIYDMHSWMSQQIEESGFIKSRWLIKKIKNLVMTETLKSLAPNIPAFTLKDCSLDIPLEVDLALKEELSKKFNLKDKTVFLYTGNFEIYQGIDLLLKAFADLIKLQTNQKKELIFLLVGGGDGQKKNIAKYQSLAKTLGVYDSVVFAGEWPVETMPTFMDLSDVLVSPRTQGNNVPLKVYTYMAAGKISVVTDINSHTQVLNSKNSIVAPTEPKAFASALAYAISEDPIVKSDLSNRIKTAKYASETRTDQIEFKEVVKNCYGLLKN
jgi:glycosyltransferase involved in cell wall biosynthesis